MLMEKTLIILKPDCVQRGLIGKIITKFEDRGILVAAMKFMQISRELAETHYEAHKEKSFFTPTVAYMTSAPVLVMVLEGKDVITTTRNTIGATNPAMAAPGTIRGDFATNIGRNLIHGSDSLETAEREISLYFSNNEIVSYQKAVAPWLTE
jgi:nucleoside-diphosphate kinase